MAAEFDSIESILEKHIPEDELREVKRVLYGKPVETLDISEEAAALSESNDFEIKAFKVVGARKEAFRAPQEVRIGLIQNSIAAPTTEPVDVQMQAIRDKLAPIIEAAGEMGVNVLCLQEAWAMPFAFCTRNKTWAVEFAESAEEGPSTLFLAEYARRYDMVIVSPILERDEAHNDTIWNTAVVISHTGKVIGKHRKNHIPRVGDFNESTYYMEGNTGHPVFETKYGRVAVAICYSRHFPLNYQAFALNKADIIFVPAATVGALSEPLWPQEARAAATQNNVHVGTINRVGTEVFEEEFTSGDGKPAHHDFGHFYGSSYVALPDGSRTPGLSRVRDGLLVTESDLNLNRQIRDKWVFNMTARLDMYADFLAEAVKPDFQPQIIKDTTTMS